MKEPFKEAKDLISLTNNSSKKIDKIDKIEAQIYEIESEAKTQSSLIKEKKKEVKNSYEELGYASYKVYKKDNKIREAYKDLFSNVDSFEEELFKIENDLKGLDGIKKNKTFINKVSGRSKIVYLQGLLKAKQLKQSSIYNKLGEKVYKSDFLTEIGDSAFPENMKHIIETKEKMAQLLRKEESMFNKKNKLIDEIEKLDGNASSSKPAKEIEQGLKKTEMKLKDIYSTLGQIYIDDSLDKDISAKEISKVFANITSLKKQNSDNNIQIEKLESAIKISEVEKDIAFGNDKIDLIKADIKKKEDDIETLEKSNADMEIEKKKQIKLRGSKDSLLTQEDVDNSNKGGS